MSVAAAGERRPRPAHREVSVSSSPSALRIMLTTVKAPSVLKP